MSSNILPKTHQKYKIKNQYEYTIDFSSPNANPILFNSSFGLSFDSNSNLELFCAPGLSFAPNDKKTKAKARKDAREKKKTEVKEKIRVVVETAKKKKRVKAEAVKEKKKVEVETVKEKKRVEVEVAKRRKELKWKRPKRRN